LLHKGYSDFQYYQLCIPLYGYPGYIDITKKER
jgi:hypothetical protein